LAVSKKVLMVVVVLGVGLGVFWGLGRGGAAGVAAKAGLAALSTEELCGKCLASTGNDYAEAKGVMIARPKEAAELAKKILDNKDAPWQSRVLAQALAEEIADPKAYAAARFELIRVALAWRNVPGPGRGGRSFTPPTGNPDPRRTYQADAENLFKLLAPSPGLKGEIILKTTADALFPQVAEVCSQDLQRRLEEYRKWWDANPADHINASFAPPAQYTPEEYIKGAPPDEPAKMLRFVRSQAALACAHAPNAETRALLKSLDSNEYAGVLAECERVLQEAASKAGAATAAASATRGAE
jgi:hypothetical protein